MRLHARHAQVRCGEDTWRCTLRKSLFRDWQALTQPLAVGDRVEATVWGPRDAVVEKVLERRSCLSRTHPGTGRQQVIVANLDLVVVTASLTEPELRPGLIDRLLVAAEREDLAAIVVLNKADLVEDRQPFQQLVRCYEKLGYPALFTSVTTGEGLRDLEQQLRDRTSVFAGHSGVGKSSLLNAIQPGLKLRTAVVSDKGRKGRHTTTAVALLPLDGGGFVVDTPGVRAFGITGLEPWQVSLCFPDLRQLSPDCHFPTCSHTHEPQCAVKAAVTAGTLEARRYESYLRILDGPEDLLEDADEPEEGA